jgi:hypothetical protein
MGVVKISSCVRLHPLLWAYGSLRGEAVHGGNLWKEKINWDKHSRAYNRAGVSCSRARYGMAPDCLSISPLRAYNRAGVSCSRARYGMAPDCLSISPLRV